MHCCTKGSVCVCVPLCGVEVFIRGALHRRRYIVWYRISESLSLGVLSVSCTLFFCRWLFVVLPASQYGLYSRTVECFRSSSCVNETFNRYASCVLAESVYFRRQRRQPGNITIWVGDWGQHPTKPNDLADPTSRKTMRKKFSYPITTRGLLCCCTHSQLARSTYQIKRNILLVEQPQPVEA